MKVVDFTERPPRMFLFLAEMSRNNTNLHRIWLRNYLRVTNGGDHD
jgi:hypothetical protein